MEVEVESNVPETQMTDLHRHQGVFGWTNMCVFPGFFEVQGLDGKKYEKNSTPKGSWEKILCCF